MKICVREIHLRGEIKELKCFTKVLLKLMFLVFLNVFLMLFGQVNNSAFNALLLKLDFFAFLQQMPSISCVLGIY